jgi:hypothetical protein
MATFYGLASQSKGLLVHRILVSRSVMIPNPACCQIRLCIRCCHLSHTRCWLVGLIYFVGVYVTSLFYLTFRSKACLYLVASASSGMGRGYSHILLLIVFVMLGRMALVQ